MGKHIRWKFVPLGYCSGEKAVFIIVVGGGYLSVFVWVVGSCLAVSGYEVLVGIDSVAMTTRMFCLLTN